MTKYEGLEHAVVGVGRRCGQQDVIIYSENKVIEILINQGMTYEEAVEHYEFNIVGAYVGETTPMFMTRRTDQ